MPVPIVTFNRYTQDGIEVSVPSGTTISSTVLSGISTDKHIYHIIVDPMEDTVVNPVEHELVFDLDPNGATEGYYYSPYSHAGFVDPHNPSQTGDDTRYGGVTDNTVDKTEWTTGLTSGVTTINPDVGFEGSGSKYSFTSGDFPQSGAVWSASFGLSGSAVLDVPTIYYGSFVAESDALTWDQIDRLHDFEMFQLHVGHNVDIADMSGVTSGTYQDNTINLFGGAGNQMYINIKTYHEHPTLWELVQSGSVVQSGTQEGLWVENQWLFIDGIDLGTPDYDQNFTIKLYASGVIGYPTPLRSIEINIYVLEGRGRFGVGRFGIARFGLASDDL